MISSALCTAWLVWKLWQSCDVIAVPSVQTVFVAFFGSAQPNSIYFGTDWIEIISEMKREKLTSGSNSISDGPKYIWQFPHFISTRKFKWGDDSDGIEQTWLRRDLIESSDESHSENFAFSTSDLWIISIWSICLGWHGTEVEFALPTQQSQVPI